MNPYNPEEFAAYQQGREDGLQQNPGWLITVGVFLLGGVIGIIVASYFPS